MKRIIHLSWVLILILILSSCRTIRQTQTEFVTVEHRDTIREMRWLHDSIFIRESEKTYTQGDTVYVIREVDRFKGKNLTDTLYKFNNRTITQKLYYTKTKEVNRLYWWQKALIWIGAIAILSCIIFLVKKVRPLF